jgi:hypothetical protein
MYPYEGERGRDGELPLPDWLHPLGRQAGAEGHPPRVPRDRPSRGKPLGSSGITRGQP